jgi:hypothetical protein
MMHRRTVLTFVGSALVVALDSPAVQADDEPTDLTSQLFNPDGSLKAIMDTEAKSRTVAIAWDDSDALHFHVDGVDSITPTSTTFDSNIRITYQLPEKWGVSGSDLYLDKTVDARACKAITVYQAPGRAPLERLQKASTVGIAQSLQVTDNLQGIRQADLIGGRTRVVNGQKYYEFDMGLAPKTCEDSKENLGLGFCPFDSVYLLSATILNDRLYVMAVECDKAEWKRANSDLKRVRSSFNVAVA